MGISALENGGTRHHLRAAVSPLTSEVTGQTLVQAQCEGLVVLSSLNQLTSKMQQTPSFWKITQANILLFRLHAAWRMCKPFVDNLD